MVIILNASKKQLQFFKHFIKEKLTTIENDIGHIRYKLYVAMVDECNNYDELREMAELEMQIDMIAYTNGELAGKLKELNTDFEKVKNIDNNIEYKITEEKKNENNELFEDLEDEDVMNAMAYMLMQRIENEPEEEKRRDELLEFDLTNIPCIDDINIDDIVDEFGDLEDIISEDEAEMGKEIDYESLNAMELGEYYNIEEDNTEDVDDDDFEIDEEDFGELDDEFDIDDSEFGDLEDDGDDEYNYNDFGEVAQSSNSTEEDEFDITEEDFDESEDEDDFDIDESEFEEFDDLDDEDELAVDEEDFDGLLEPSEIEFDEAGFGELEDSEFDEAGFGELEDSEFDELDDIEIDEDDFGDIEEDLSVDIEDEFDGSGFEDLLGDEDEFDIDINDFADVVEDDDITDVSKAKSKKPIITDDSSDYINNRKVTKENVFNNGTDRGKKTQEAFNTMIKIGGITAGFGKKAAKTVDKGSKAATKAAENSLDKFSKSNIFNLPDEDDEFIDF